MKYLTTLLTALLIACAPSRSLNDPSPWLLVDNRGTQDVVVYLQPVGQRVGRCVSFQTCRLDLTTSQEESLLQGLSQISYRRLATNKTIVMPILTQRDLQLIVGLHDTTSYLTPRSP